MARRNDPTFATPREDDLGVRRIGSDSGLEISALPGGGLFAIEYRHQRGRTMINQVLGSPHGGGIGRLYLRVRSPVPLAVQAVGPGARVRFGAARDRLVWEGQTDGLRHRAVLWLHPERPLWLWRLEVANRHDAGLTCDALLVQDLGLAARGFLMNNEAFASQYIDHHIAQHPRFGPVVMSRQNLAQDGRHPWVAHGCLQGSASFATDASQLFGPAFRDAAEIPAELDLPGRRRQHEVACAMVQTKVLDLEPGEAASWTFFGLYEPDHPEASKDADLARLDAVEGAERDLADIDVELIEPVRSVVPDAPPVVAGALDETEIGRRYPERWHEERRDGRLLSFFVPDGAHNRHVVLRDKERLVTRRHGAMLRSGQGMLLDDRTLCATAWMHGVFGAQLTIGNTSFHKLFSVARDPYNVTRGSGLRMLIDAGRGWRLLTVPSVFEIGLSDCRWIYRAGERTVTVHAMASGEDPAMQWRVEVEGPPCRFLVLGQLVLGERELEHAGQIATDGTGKRLACRPDPAWLWGQRYPDAIYHLVTSTPEVVEALGGDELLYPDGERRSGGWLALRTGWTHRVCLVVTGSLTDPEEAERLAGKYQAGVDDAAMLEPAAAYWQHVTRGLRFEGDSTDVKAIDTILPWFVHDAMVHLTVPRGLEQYTGAAWGTRDVCQGPIELLLPLGHDSTVKEILRVVFAQQYEQRGDWPQWFMLEPYSPIQDRHSHGDVIVWPIKALCDYIEATGDLQVLDEPVAWRREDTLERTVREDPIAAHVDKLLATVRARFIPGTHLIRYGEGDWNDSLQPADPSLRDWMVSSWTVALLFQQVGRYAAVMARAGQGGRAEELRALAGSMRADFERHLVRDGTVAGYALFKPEGGAPELLLHPSDTRTGLHYALLPMTRGIIAGLLSGEAARHHLGLIREHLLFPDGVRLMDRPVAYRGGVETIFRRAESAAFFGREIGLMYIHAHLRYGEAMAVLGEAEALWEALRLANPVTVTECLPHASLRQRNAYFSSSDAAFDDRYKAGAEWHRVRDGTVAVDGGWRIYSSGPGLYIGLLLDHALGVRRRDGERSPRPLLPEAIKRLSLELETDGRRQRFDLA